MVLDGIQYGFSLQYCGPVLEELEIEAHASASNYPQHVEDYLKTEIREGAIIGPFMDPPFVEWCRTSPLMTRPKGDGDKRRVIVDLSFPPDKNVNIAVTKNNYYGRFVAHKLPRIDDVVDVIVGSQYEVALATVDIRRAYHNFPGCPLDLPLNNIKFKGRYYIDLAMPFGARTSSCYMQKIAEYISRALASRQIYCHIYLDDVIMYFQPDMDPPARMREALAFIKALGLPLAEEKSQMPSSRVKYLGVWLDVDAKMITMPIEKIDKFLKLVEFILDRPAVSKKVIQTLVGKIVHFTACIPAARTFVNRILEALRASHHRDDVLVDHGVIQDLKWFKMFLSKYNGRSMMRQSQPKFTIEADACMDGAGATDFTSYRLSS